MKLLFIFGIFLYSLTVFASEEGRYDWKTIAYTTHLEELGVDAELVIFTEYSSVHEHAIISKIKFKVGGKNIILPQEILNKFGPIHPTSFSISAGDFSYEGKAEKWITLYFNYGIYPKIRDGSMSFLNGNFKAYSIYEEPNS